jgi:two-component system OmpR family sensor kinase
MQIRWRLTLWFGLILCGILILSSSVLYVLLQRNLSDQVDDNLRVYSARIHGTLDPREIPEPLDYDVIHSKLPAINEFASPGIYIQLLDRSGNVIVKSDSLGEQELPVDPALIEAGFGGTSIIQTVAAGDDAGVRIMVSPMYFNDQVLLLEVAQSMQFVDATMRQVRWALLASILVALILATVLGGGVVRSALNPVSRITQTARSIETGADLTRRVGYRGPMDEIGEMAITFDNMIEHLDRVFTSQKHFVGDASHELRGPLTVIKGNLDLLKRDLGAADREESLRVIAAETTRMSAIVNDLLLLAEVKSSQSLSREPVALTLVLDEEVERVSSIAGDRQLELRHLEDIVVNGERQKLKQMIGNLIDNAIKYSPDGGRITLSLFRDGEWACFEVTDTGIGISSDDLPNIFDRFYRVDKARSRGSGSTGLGLAIVKGIAEQYGGGVTVASELNVGSTFSVRLKL